MEDWLAAVEAGGRSCQNLPVQRRDETVGPDAENGIFGRLLGFLNRLDEAGIYYTLGHTRADSVMADISLPGWRWEVEFMLDGSVEIERYKSFAGVESDARLLEELIADADRA
jgi:hypothetical protein